MCTRSVTMHNYLCLLASCTCNFCTRIIYMHLFSNPKAPICPYVIVLHNTLVSLYFIYWYPPTFTYLYTKIHLPFSIIAYLLIFTNTCSVKWGSCQGRDLGWDWRLPSSNRFWSPYSSPCNYFYMYFFGNLKAIMSVLHSPIQTLNQSTSYSLGFWDGTGDYRH